MNVKVSAVVVAVATPVVVFFVIAKAMSTLSGRDAALAASRPPNPKPLNTRWSYRVDDVAEFWGALGPAGDVAEQRFLKYDLVFPLAYGGTLAASLLWLGRQAGLPGTVLLVAPVVVGVISDWTENVVQLQQIQLYTAKGRQALQRRAVRIASIATAVKLGSLCTAYMTLVGLGLFLIRKA